MAKINKTYKPGDEFTPDSVNEIIAAINKNVDDVETKANTSDVSSTYATINSVNTELAKKANTSDVSSTYATINSVNTELAKKANTSALGTQVTFSLSGTTLTIKTK